MSKVKMVKTLEELDAELAKAGDKLVVGLFLFLSLLFSSFTTNALTTIQSINQSIQQSITLLNGVDHAISSAPRWTK